MKSDNITVPSCPERGLGLLPGQIKERLEGSRQNSAATSPPATLKGTRPVRDHEDRDSAGADDGGRVQSDNNVPHGKQYVYARTSSNSSYVYVQKSQYGLVYSSLAQLVVNVKNKKITGYYQTYSTDLSSVRELQATISPLRAVTNPTPPGNWPTTPNNAGQLGYQIDRGRGSVISSRPG